ncbi:ethanolamine utilization EutQ family protein [Klebsiella aerogenes]|nr:ethanolamine utilization EutQ family protein [Klebsiella aerogenes]
MKKLITANDIRAAHARGEQAMSVVLRASIITPEAREVAELLGFTITEDDGAAPAATAADSDKTEKPADPRNHPGAVAGRPVYRKAWWRS